MPKKKEVKEEVKVVETPVLSEKDQLLQRHAELTNMHAFLQANKLQDIGQLENELARINLRLTQL